MIDPRYNCLNIARATEAGQAGQAGLKLSLRQVWTETTNTTAWQQVNIITGYNL